MRVLTLAIHNGISHAFKRAPDSSFRDASKSLHGLERPTVRCVFGLAGHFVLAQRGNLGVEDCGMLPRLDTSYTTLDAFDEFGRFTVTLGGSLLQ